MTCPCAVCEIRYVGCHAKCVAYAAWKAEKDAAFQKRAEMSVKRGTINAYIKDTPSRKRFLRRKKK